jgi:hypothetical protein
MIPRGIKEDLNQYSQSKMVGINSIQTVSLTDLIHLPDIHFVIVKEKTKKPPPPLPITRALPVPPPRPPPPTYTTTTTTHINPPVDASGRGSIDDVKEQLTDFVSSAMSYTIPRGKIDTATAALMYGDDSESEREMSLTGNMEFKKKMVSHVSS